MAVYSVTNLDDSTTAKVTTAAAVLLTAMAQAINAGAAAPLKRYYFELSKAV